MNPFYIDDLYILINQYLKLQQVFLQCPSKRHYQWLKQASWFQCIILQPHYLPISFHLKNINLSRTNLTNAGLKYLSACHTLDLSYTKIIDKELKYLSACHTLNLCSTKITNAGLKYLSACHTLDLSHTNITDDGLKYLSTCHTLNLKWTNITNEGLKHLTAVKIIK